MGLLVINKHILPSVSRLQTCISGLKTQREEELNVIGKQPAPRQLYTKKDETNNNDSGDGDPIENDEKSDGDHNKQLCAELPSTPKMDNATQGMLIPVLTVITTFMFHINLLFNFSLL